MIFGCFFRKKCIKIELLRHVYCFHITHTYHGLANIKLRELFSGVRWKTVTRLPNFEPTRQEQDSFCDEKGKQTNTKRKVPLKN